jgi:hypothetical protein
MEDGTVHKQRTTCSRQVDKPGCTVDRMLIGSGKKKIVHPVPTRHPPENRFLTAIGAYRVRNLFIIAVKRVDIR